ncbi:MAG TPA: WD40 repeat domain-containing protein, partial [Urbifossiella sp.]|nr:WD40 repeat domain-containing protein [Urbifossiella sp.]
GLVIGLVAAVVVLGGGAFAAYWFGFRNPEKVAGPPAPAQPAAGQRKTPVPDGWRLYTIPECGFRVALPAPPIEDAATSRGTAAKNAVGRMFRSPAAGFAATPSRVLCGAGRVTVPAAVPADQRRLVGFQSFRSDQIEQQPGARVLTRRPAPVGAYPGEEVVVEIQPPDKSPDPPTFWVIRSAVVGDDVVVMAVWKEHARTTPELEDGFFDSFEVTGSPSWAQPKTSQPAGGPPASTSGPLLPTNVVSVDETDLSQFTLSPDGGTVGLAGMGRKAGGEESEHLSVFYDLTTGKRVGVPIVLYGPGAISTGGKTTVYSEGSKIFDRDIATGKQSEAAEVVSGHFSSSPDGKLLVTATKSKLAFRPLPPGDAPAPEAEAGSPVHGLSPVFLQGTRIAAVQYDAGDVVVRVWDVKTGRPVDEVPLNRPKREGAFAREQVLVAEDGKAMITETEQGGRVVWDLSAKKRIGWTSSKMFTTLKPATGGRMFYQEAKAEFAGGTATVKYFVVVADLRTGNVVYKLQYPAGVDSLISVSAESSLDGKRFVALCSQTRRIYVWDLPR